MEPKTLTVCVGGISPDEGYLFISHGGLGFRWFNVEHAVRVISKSSTMSYDEIVNLLSIYPDCSNVIKSKKADPPRTWDTTDPPF